MNVLKSLKRSPDVMYAGRPPMAATATGYGKVHELELKNLIQDALNTK
jgi:2-oxoglutarate dehydrogenase complex dehydrogenase (E1) component-like enzyme